MTDLRVVTDVEPEPDETLPPQDIAAERAVLGSAMLSKAALEDLLELLAPGDFYRPNHGTIWNAITGLHGRGEPVDAVTVADELTTMGVLPRVGGAAYLHDLVGAVPSAASGTYYAGIVAERAVLRRMVEAGTRIVQLGHARLGGDVADIVQAAHREMDSVTIRATAEPTHEQDVYAAVAALEDEPGCRPHGTHSLRRSADGGQVGSITSARDLGSARP